MRVIEGITLDPKGNPVIAATTADPIDNTAAGYLFKLSAEDGSLLPAAP